MMSLEATVLPTDLDILRPSPSHNEAVSQYGLYGALPVVLLQSTRKSWTSRDVGQNLQGT